MSGRTRVLVTALAVTLSTTIGTGALVRLSAQTAPAAAPRPAPPAAAAAPANNTAPTAFGPAVGYFEATADLGSPAIKGSTSYDAATQTYTLSAGGTNMWGTRDEFQFAWRKMNGDFLIRTHVKFVGAGVDPHRKIGVIIRKGLEADSPYVDATLHGDGLTSLQHRQEAGGVTATIRAAITHADVLELKREGRRYIAGVAKFGEPMVYTEFYGPDLGPDVHVGLFACSHNPKVKETATFTNVRIVVPPKVGWVPYRDYIGSNLEVMDIATGHRTVLHTSPISIQAPNWTNDGKTLIFNGSGKLWTFDFASKAVAQFNTGSVIRNNNDHVLSFDGTMLGISSGSNDPADGNRSVVWVLPATGGEPKRVTPLSPSYLHGWSPDKKWLFYTGQRNNELDIYKIAVDGGEEIRLTSTEGVDDGSELTPDGQWIYFNSNRSGHMQIWRMKPDGSGQEQITHDRFNNWFPHIAPDGKSMVIISYGEDIQSGDHPFYKHVYLRHLALDGSNAKVIAYLFGGQGTINVPSWSPDGKKIAFVSNTALPAPVAK